jgi:S1-C subfamily serine protease
MGPTGRGGSVAITGGIKLPALGSDLRTGGGRVFLGTVAGGSPFARAGIQAGDEIGSINGKSVDTMTQAEIEAAFRNKNVQVVVWRDDGKNMFSTGIQTP